MKFTLISSALFLATAAMASPDGLNVNSIVSDVEGIYSTAVDGGQSIGSDIASKATSFAEAASTGGAAAISSIESEASAAASEGRSIGSEITSRVVTAVSAQTTLTDSAGSTTATDSSSSSGSSDSSGSSSTSDNAAFARPTAVGAAAAGMAGVLGLMVAL
ncbi:unnamed protein product [Penicillium palitans]